MAKEEQLYTISQFFHNTCGRFSSRPAQIFNPDLYHGDNSGSFTYGEMQD